MIVVNDLSGVRNVPQWIDHVKGYEDGMHFADIIFPIFLFIAGLSIPLAIGRRLSKGDSFASITVYILSRSFALIIMGFFHVNMEEYNPDAILPAGVWELLLTISFFLIWLDYPATLSQIKKYVLIGTGVLILVMLAFLYKGGTTSEPKGLQPSWWGILGIIGWAYLLCSGAYLIAKGNIKVLAGVLALFVAINIATHAGLIDINIWIIKDGASASLMMFGVVTTLAYLQLTSLGKYRELWQIFSLSALVLVAMGFIVRPFTQGISKIHSTPAWVFICTGIGLLVFALMIWLVDVKEKQNWFNIIKPAGTSTLTCYLIPYLMVAVFTLVNFRYPHIFNYGTGGIIRSFAIAFITIFITGLLEKKRLRLKI